MIGDAGWLVAPTADALAARLDDALGDGRPATSKGPHGLPTDGFRLDAKLVAMTTNGQLRRFENKAQLLRHIAEETGADIDTLWDEYDAQTE